MDKTVETSSDSRAIFRYLIPIASLATVRRFYEERMKAGGWTLYVQSGRSLSFYKGEGERRVSLGLGTEPGRVILTIDASTSPKQLPSTLTDNISGGLLKTDIVKSVTCIRSSVSSRCRTRLRSVSIPRPAP